MRDAGQGRLDSPLTSHRRQHAADLARLVSTLDIDVIVSSPIGRALTTANTAAEALGVSVVVIDELAELDHGGFAGLTPSEIEARYPGARAERAQHKYVWRFPGGESYAGADQRAAAALGQVGRSGALRPLIVSHEMVGRHVGAQPAECVAGGGPDNRAAAHCGVPDRSVDGSAPQAWHGPWPCRRDMHVSLNCCRLAGS